MQKISKGSVDADRRLMAKARVCTKIVGIEPMADGRSKEFHRTSYNERQWHNLYVYCWQHKDDFEFEYKTADQPRALSSAQMAKMGIEVENDDDIIRKNKVYTEDDLKASGMRIKELRAICIAKGLPDEGDKRDMINAILEVQGIEQE